MHPALEGCSFPIVRCGPRSWFTSAGSLLLLQKRRRIVLIEIDEKSHYLFRAVCLLQTGSVPNNSGKSSNPGNHRKLPEAAKSIFSDAAVFSHSVLLQSANIQADIQLQIPHSGDSGDLEVTHHRVTALLYI